MVLQFSLLGSGSSGNALLVSSPSGRLLIDNGLSYRQLEHRVAKVGECLDDLLGVFVTHEHSDHVAGLGVLSRKLNVPIFITDETYRSLPASLGKLSDVRFFEAGSTVQVGDYAVDSFRVAHDAADPVSFVVRSNGTRLGIATDLGHACPVVQHHLKGCNALILESNYCPDMLLQSSYPPAIRARINSRLGHLSNHAMNSLLKKVLHDGLRLVVLVHISEENNTPDLARSLAQNVVKGLPVEVVVANRDEPTGAFAVAV